MSDQCLGCRRFVRLGVNYCTNCVVREENDRLRRERNEKALREMVYCPYPYGACVCGDVDPQP